MTDVILKNAVSKPRILVSGGSGFVGRHLVNCLLARGYKVHTLGRSRPADTSAVWHQINLLNPRERAGIMHEVRPELFVHCAWETRPGYFPGAPENLDWLAASLDLLRTFAAEGGRRAILIGSGLEYGNGTVGPVDENSPCQPSTLYGHTKNALREIALASAAALGLEVAWARLFHLAGPGDNVQRLPAAAAHAFLRGEDFRAKTPDMQHDYMDVRDAAVALAQVIDSRFQGTINIASGRAVSVGALVEIVRRQVTRAPVLSEHVAEKPNRDTQTAPLLPDVSLAQQWIPGLAATNMYTTIADMISEMRVDRETVTTQTNGRRSGPGAVKRLETPPPAFVPILQALAIGAPQQAESAARDLLRTMPADDTLGNMLALALRMQGRMTEALDLLKEIVARSPDLHAAQINLATLLNDMGAVEDAVPHLRAALLLQPEQLVVRTQLLQILTNTGRIEEAAGLIDELLLNEALAPAENAALLLDRARISLRQEAAEDALQFAQRSLAASPTGAGSILKAMTLYKLGRVQEALDVLREARATWPSDRTIQLSWAQACLSRGDHRAANDTLRALLDVEPDHEIATAKYLESLLNSRYDDEAKHLDEAAERARMALQRFVLTAKSRSIDTLMILQSVFQRVADEYSLSVLMNAIGSWRAMLELAIVGKQPNAFLLQLPFVESMDDRRAVLDAHLSWGRQVTSANVPTPRLGRSRASGDRLRVGLLSGDLRNHPVGYFVYPFIKRYDSRKIELIGYHTFPGVADPIQTQISETITMHSCADLRDDALVERIAADHVDVLLDLSGLTLYGRPMVLAQKPAPVQVSWLGYIHSLGLPNIDYLITDQYTEPADRTLLAENPLQLPRTSYIIDRLGFPDIAIVEEPPQLGFGSITFGTANNSTKYSDRTIALWARVLQAVPGSRFLFIRPEGASQAFRAGISAAFAKHGIEATRLTFVPVRGGHLQHYNQIDVALDTLPRTGATTTCETIWMGVPTITLVGPAFYERLSFSVLSAAGLSDFCAFTEDSFVEIAVRVAKDAEFLRRFRRRIRAQIRANPLGQPQSFASDLTQALLRIAL